jgi:enterochelin esterase-like enzyme
MSKDNESGSYIDELNIWSEFLQEEITLMVYVPPAYSPLYTYPVLYASDGQDYFHLGRIARIADEGIENGEINDFIVVGIPYKNVNDRREKYHPKGEKCVEYQRFLVEELVPFIDRRYSTHELAYGRALIGDSLAGTISLITSLNYPHTFANVLMQSPYINEQVKSLVEDFSNETAPLDIYHVIGTEEKEVETTKGKTKDFLTPNRELKEIFEEKPFAYFYDEFSGDHTWTFWQPDLKRTIKHIYGK